MDLFKYCALVLILAICVLIYQIPNISLSALNAGVTSLFVVFGVFPFIFKYSYSVQKFFVFLSSIQWPLSRKLPHPERLGIQGTRNFYIKGYSRVNHGSVTLGVWHVLPSSFIDRDNHAERRNDTFDQILKSEGKPVIIYAHGNSNNRGCAHRVGLYKMLQSLDCHVIAFDYRGYGDSSRMTISEMGVVEDLIIVYNWVLTKVGSNANVPIFIWGHSLGTGIANHAMALIANNDKDSGIELPSRDLPPRGVFLESPFNNFHDELQGHIMTKLYSWTPWFLTTMVDPVVENGIKFESDVHIADYPWPVLILHADEDIIVPYKLGVKLYETAKSSRNKDAGEVTMISFTAAEKLGHKNIYKSPKLPDIVSDFIATNSKKIRISENK